MLIANNNTSPFVAPPNGRANNFPSLLCEFQIQEQNYSENESHSSCTTIIIIILKGDEFVRLIQFRASRTDTLIVFYLKGQSMFIFSSYFFSSPSLLHGRSVCRLIRTKAGRYNIIVQGSYQTVLSTECETVLYALCLLFRTQPAEISGF